MTDFFVMFGNCVPVNGIRRSIIYDLQNCKYDFIPNELFNILTHFKQKSIQDIISFYGEENKEIIKSYFKFLVDKGYIFLTQEPSLIESFPQLSPEWDFPAEITNAVIDFNSESNNMNQLPEIIMQLDELNCRYLQLRFFSITDISKVVYRTLSFLSQSGIMAIEIYAPYIESYNDEKYFKSILINNGRITKMVFFNAPNIANASYYDTDIFFITVNLLSEKDCGRVSPGFFTCNIGLFTESQKFNTCLNRKIGIDVDGNIKNCPSMSKKFGNISERRMSDVVKMKNFRSVWKINKDKILVCKECEFRYMCTDCSAFLEDPKNIYSKPLKCGYNPHTCEWEEWSNNPLKNDAISHYGFS